MRAIVVFKLTPYAFALLVAVQSGACDASARTDAVRQLIDATSLGNILRTDAEQASMIVDQLPEDLPAELRADIRRAIDQNLGYVELEASLATTLAAQLDFSTLDGNLRWWASSPGRAISRMESSAYASIVPASSFNAYNPTRAAPLDVSSGVFAELTANGHFSEFVGHLRTSTEASRSRLLLTVNIGRECPRDDSTDGEHDAPLLQLSAAATNDGYSRIPTGDMNAYLSYLRSESAQSTMRALHTSLLAVEQKSWANALKQAANAIDVYAEATYGSMHDAALRLTTADIDRGQNLSNARITLELMRRAVPSDPAILVQSARVVLKQGPDLTVYDGPPSVPRVDPNVLDSAQGLLDQALALDPRRAETLMLMGHVAYLKLQFQRSVDLLEQAEGIGIDSPWLQINMGDVLWAMALRPPTTDHALARRAANEFEAALRPKLPIGAEWRAVHQLCDIYAELGDIQKADSFHRRYVSLVEGLNKAIALQRYALFLLVHADDVDASIVAARQAVQVEDFPLGRSFLVDVLAMKGGKLVAAGRVRDAAPYFAEAKQLQPDLESICPELARFQDMLPGVFGIHAEGLIKDFSGSIGGQTLVYASRYATADEIKQLLVWGANPNYFDSEEGTSLHQAILFNNVAAVRVLLDHGANPLTPYVDGRAADQMTDDSPDVIRQQIKTLVAKAAASRNSALGPVGTPLRVGYRYRLKQPIRGDRFGYDFAAGEQIIYVSECQYTDSAIACFVVKSMRYHNENRDLGIAKDQLSSWSNWFEELGPAEDAGKVHEGIDIRH